jgi:hypothetical protein
MYRLWRLSRIAVILVLLAVVHLHTAAQEQKAPPLISSSARLAAAKSAFLTGTAGSKIPYDVIESSLEGWGRFALVETPAKADIVMEVSTAAQGGAGVSGPIISPRGRSGSPAAAQQNSISQIRLAIYDAKTKVLLWSAVESLRPGWHKKTYEDNLMEASARLVSRLRDQLEPPPAK